jgi:NADPH2:quinone reductase
MPHRLVQLIRTAQHDGENTPMIAWTVPIEPTGDGDLLTLAEAPEPEPQAHELLVRVDAFAPNPGDLAALPNSAPGTIPGWDGSGVVLRPAADGTGPTTGERVAFLGLTGGWAQHRAVPSRWTAAAPADAPVENLATLPVPATSALRALRRLGSLVGRRVLVTGATGAVGRHAVQLAARSGAHVVAVARDRTRHDELRRLGAHETHRHIDTVSVPVHGAIDMVGGQTLVDAYGLLDPGGTVIALGHGAQEGEHFPFGTFVADPSTADRSITSFFLANEPAIDSELAFLAAAELDPLPVETRPWTELGEWIGAGSPRDAGRVLFRVDHGRQERGHLPPG